MRWIKHNFATVMAICLVIVFGVMAVVAPNISLGTEELPTPDAPIIEIIRHGDDTPYDITDDTYDIINVEDSMEYNIVSATYAGEWLPCEGVDFTGLKNAARYWFREKKTATSNPGFVSEPVEYGVFTAPTGIDFVPNEGENTFQLTGLTTEMEYNKEGPLSQEWSRWTAEEIKKLREEPQKVEETTIFYIRTAAKAGNEEEQTLATEVSIPTRICIVKYGYQAKEDGSYFLTGLNTKIEYRKKATPEEQWTKCTSTNTEDFNENAMYEIRVAASAEEEPSAIYTTQLMKITPKAPILGYEENADGLTVKITNITEGMKYATDPNGPWTDYDVNHPLNEAPRPVDTGITYYAYVAATENNEDGFVGSINLPFVERAEAPNLNIDRNPQNETVEVTSKDPTNLPMTKIQSRLGEGEWEDCKKETLVIENGGIYSFREKVEEGFPDGNELKALILIPKNNGDNTIRIDGVDATMEYKKDDGQYGPCDNTLQSISSSGVYYFRVIEEPELKYIITIEDEESEYEVVVQKNIDGGTVTGSGNYAEDEIVTITAEANDGYTFVGWEVVDDKVSLEDSTANSTTFTMPSEGVTITAKFKGEECTVTLDAQGAQTVGTESVSLESGAELPNITVPQKTHFIFNGYFTEVNGEGEQYYSADGTPATTNEITEDITLYADWELNYTHEDGIAFVWTVEAGETKSLRFWAIHGISGGMTVEWGDGNTWFRSNETEATIQNTYEVAGEYLVIIKGSLWYTYFENTTVDYLEVREMVSETTLYFNNSIVRKLKAVNTEKFEGINGNNSKFEEIDLTSTDGFDDIYLKDCEVGLLDIRGLSSLNEIKIENSIINTIEANKILMKDEERRLYFKNSNAQKIDLSEATMLELEISGDVDDLNLRGITVETKLTIDGSNNISELDVSGLTGLTSLAIGGSNNISELDVSGLTGLTSLAIGGSNNISELDVSGLTGLTSLAIGGSNNINELDVSGLTGLTSLIVDGNNNISELNVSGLTQLTSLTVSGNNKISQLNVSGLPALISLTINNNENLAELNISNLAVLTSLTLTENNKLNKLNISELNLLTKLNIYKHLSLNEVNISELPLLSTVTFNINNDKLENVSFKNLPMLTSLHIGGYDNLTELELEGLMALTTLECNHNNLSNLDVSGLTALTELDCNNNNLTELELEGLTALTTLKCYDNNLSNLDVSGLTALTTLKCNNNNLSNLDVSGLTALTELVCNNNNLSNLDVSGLTVLTKLDCDNNNLTELELEGLTALITLKCSKNYLETLDLRNSSQLNGVCSVQQTLETVYVTQQQKDNLPIEETQYGCAYSPENEMHVYKDTKVIVVDQECTITFDSNEGSDIKPITVLSGNPYGELEEPTKEGQIFGGWYLEETFETKVDSTTLVATNESHTLYARWSTTPLYTVTVATDIPPKGTITGGGDYEANDTVILIATAEKDYAFKNWEITGVSVDEEKLTNATLEITMPSENVSVKANFVSANGIEVTFNVNGGNNITSTTKEVTYNKLYGELITPTREGYSFAGWYTEPESGELVTRETIVTKVVPHTLYAHWNTGNAITFKWDTTGQKEKKIFLETIGTTLIDWGDGSVEDIDYNSNLYLKHTYKAEKEYTVTIKDNVVKELRCEDEKIKQLDASQNTALMRLTCTRNNLKELEVNNLTSLTFLACGRNDLTDLNISDLTHLTYFNCEFNNLTKLDASGLRELTILDCYANDLTELDVSGLTQLESLKCSSNDLTDLNISELTQLESLRCSGNNLTKLDVSSVTELTTLDCSVNGLIELDVSELTQLKSLDCSGNNLTKLDVSSVTELTTLDCSANGLTELDVSELTQLKSLDCSGNNLSKLELNNLAELKSLDCSSNYLETLDLRRGNQLNEICCAQETLETVYVTQQQKDNLTIGIKSSNCGNILHENEMHVYENTDVVVVDQECTIMFDSNEGSDIKPITVLSGNPYGELEEPTKEGQIFGGWYLEETFENKVESTTLIATDVAHTLYARWSTTPLYTVTATTETPHMGTVIGGGDYEANNTVTLVATAKSGYKLKNWEVTGVSVDEEKLTNATLEITMPSGEVNVTANFEAISGIVVTFDVNGGDSVTPATKEVTYDAPYGKLATATRENHTFAGWNTSARGSGTKVTEKTVVTKTLDHTLYAQWTENISEQPTVYEVTTVAENGTVAGAGSYEENATVTLTATANEGYTFTSWEVSGVSLDPEDLTNETITFTMPSTDLTVKVNFTAISGIVVTFDANEGEVVAPITKEVTYDAVYGELATATREGYTFAGWYTEGGEEVTKETVVKTAEPHTLYAQWIMNIPEQPEIYEVTAIAENGTVDGT